MSFAVLPPARPFAEAPAESSFGEAVRNAASPPIPPEVRDQVDAAARLAEDLHSQGRRVRFDVNELDGNVVANLVDDDGDVLRPLPLGDVIDVDRLAHELSKEQP
jgi:hypothetical protein